MKFVKSLSMASALIVFASGAVMADAGSMMVQNQQQIRSQDMARLQSRINQGNGIQNQYQHSYQNRYQNNNSGYGRGYESRRGSIGGSGFGGSGSRGGGRH